MDEVLEQNIEDLPAALCFMGEARFGRMSDPRRCWAPAPYRPSASAALVREFRMESAEKGLCCQ